MKSILISLSLIACAQQSTLEAPPLPEQQSLEDVQTMSVVPASIGLAGVALSVPSGQVGASVEEPLVRSTPVLHCASSAWSFGSGLSPAEGVDVESVFQVSRITIFADEGAHSSFAPARYSARVETGYSHRPEVVTSEVFHDDVDLWMDESSLWLEWGDVSLSAWREMDRGGVFTGGAWGNLSAPPAVEGVEPPPPCGFEIYMSCWEPNQQQPAGFQYDSETGKCVNANQEEGLNYKPVEYIRETKDGECADLSWSSLDELVPFDITLSSWNLAGAKLTDAWLSSTLDADGNAADVYLKGAALEGTDLSRLNVPKGSIFGSIDSYTQLPDMDCIVDEDLVDCEI